MTALDDLLKVLARLREQRRTHQPIDRWAFYRALELSELVERERADHETQPR